jgi:AbrB family looped-hinge helix DNA binding protein
MQPATVTAKGQVTIPKAIREHLGLKPSAKVKFFIGHDGRVFVLPVRPISELRGMVKYDGPPVSIEEMDEGIAAAVVARFERSRAK